MKLYIRETMLPNPKSSKCIFLFIYLKCQHCEVISSTVHRVVVFHVKVNPKSQAWRRSCFWHVFVPRCLEECCSTPNQLLHRKANMTCSICFIVWKAFSPFVKYKTAEKMADDLTLKPLLHAEKTCISLCYCLMPPRLTHQFRVSNSNNWAIQ